MAKKLNKNIKIHPMAFMPIAPGSRVLAPGGEIVPTDLTSLLAGASGIASSAVDPLLKSGAVENTNTRNMGEFAATSKGALKGAGVGAQIGMNPLLMTATAGLSAPIGAALGAIGGGVTGFNNKQKEVSTYQNNKANLYRELGGPIDIIEGPTHEQGGVQITENTEVEGGEAKVGNEVLSDRLVNPLTGNTFAKDAEKIKRKYKEREYDPYSQKSMDKELQKLISLNKQEREKQEALDQTMQQDYLALGGFIKPNTKGELDFDEDVLGLVDSLASERGLSSSDYKKKMLAFGGNTKDPVNPIIANALGNAQGITNYMNNQDPLLNPQISKALTNSQNITNSINSIINNPDVLKAVNNLSGNFPIPEPVEEEDETLDPFTVDEVAPNISAELLDLAPASTGVTTPIESFLDEEDDDDITFDFLDEQPLTPKSLSNLPPIPTTAINELAKSYQKPVDKKVNTDAENLALLASNLAPMDNLLKSISPEVTSLEKADLSTIDMTSAKTMAQNEAAKTKAVLAENARSGGNSSAAVLAALASGNATVSDNLTDALSQISLQEAMANNEIQNREKLTNVELTNKEQEINQMNRAMADSIQNLALADIGTNTQGYTRDVKASVLENQKNKQLVSVISSLDPNYKVLEENGLYVIKYLANGVEKTIPLDKGTKTN